MRRLYDDFTAELANVEGATRAFLQHRHRLPLTPPADIVQMIAAIRRGRETVKQELREEQQALKVMDAMFLVCGVWLFGLAVGWLLCLTWQMWR